MMAEKARIFGDAAKQKEILASASPGKAKSLGRQVSGYVEETWARERFDVVVRGNFAKFEQHERLRHFLLGTRDKILVEASPSDRVWGIGLAASDPKATHPEQWNGQNLLGFALMEARARLR
jgi:ribA/ribD-fused uncharacterized protein